MWEQAQRLTAWSGGVYGLLAVLLVQLLLLAVMALLPELALGAMLGLVGVVLVMDRPLLAVGILILARLLSTGATVFFRIGSMGIGPLEPALALCLGALVFHAAFSRVPLWQAWPWRAPYLLFLSWIGLSVLWSVNRGGALGELLPMLIVLANTMVLLAFVKTWADFRLMLWIWVGACVLIGLLAIASNVLGIQVGNVSFKAASGGGRETGLGQQPNWFAMNLMFIIPTCFGMALLEQRRWLRGLLALSGLFVFVMMLQAGSRGGAYATLIGGVFVALVHPLFRRWFFRFAALTVAIFAIGIAFDVGDSAQALTRISSNVSINSNIRFLNWQVCMQMFADTWGRGIGASGYETLLPVYNNYIAQSLYDYPHGIFWEVSAHYGLVGLILLGWLVVSVIQMTQELARMARGTEAEVFVWTMPAAMLGYAAWSFVEFSVNEKPVWEFLALYTALYLIVRRSHEEGRPLPAWSSKMTFFRRASAEPEPSP